MSYTECKPDLGGDLMYLILGFLIVCIPLIIVQWCYAKWIDAFREPKHHKDDSYIDDSFKLNFIKKKVEEKEKYK